MSKHTPAPWKIDSTVRIGTDGGKHAYVEVNSTTKALWIAKVQTFTDDSGEFAANARLIAAAPRLLLVAQAASHALKSYQHGNSSPNLAKEVAAALDEAIAEAEGR